MQSRITRHKIIILNKENVRKSKKNSPIFKCNIPSHCILEYVNPNFLLFKIEVPFRGYQPALPIWAFKGGKDKKVRKY